MSLADEVNLEGHLDQLRKDNQLLYRKLEKAKIKTADMIDAVFAAAYQAVSQTGPLIPISPARQSGGKPEMALLHLTDWQYGKKTSSYSMKVCERRVEQAIAKTEELANIQRADHPVNECHLALGGDMVEGESVFKGQVWEIEGTLFEQWNGVANLIARSVSRLCEVFSKVVVWEESGNHGRVGMKGDFSPDTNFDRMAYKLAKAKVRSKNLTWHEQDGWHKMITVGNYQAMLAHGDEIRGVNAIRSTAEKWASGKIVEPFSDVYLGHFHTPMTLTMANSNRVFVTGTTESDSEYAAKNLAATNTPTQRLHFIDPRRGRVTSEHTLWLD